MKTEGVVLCSGGLDSTTLMYFLDNAGTQFLPLFLDYGQHCAKTELSTLQKVIPEKYVKRIVTLDISAIYRGGKSRLIKEPDLWSESVEADDLYLPYRNMLFLAIAAAYAQSRDIGKVYAAFINSNHAKEIDCSTAFFDELGSVLKKYGAVQIEMPFRSMSKYEVAKLGLELKVPIAKTFSCQASSEVPCGACPNCVERIEALRQLSQ
jgi:7-cyano-7-deazaguanine synthase